ncbi:MAG: ChaN family lipoprotein [Desulfomonilaceae bacterium]
MRAKILKSIFSVLSIMAFCFFGHTAPCSTREASIIVDLLMGEPVTFESALDDMSQVRVVYVGEFHTIIRHHQLQEEILGGLAHRNRKVSLAMEMFNADQQSIVDKWLSSNESVSVLGERLGSDRWTNISDYSGLLLKARDLHIPIVGLNLSSGLVRKVSRGGLNALSESERAMLPPDVEPVSPVYARLLTLRLQVHRAFHGKSLNRVIYAQALRDTVMASNIVKRLSDPLSKDGILMVVAGNGHLSYGLGVPERVKRRIDVTSRIFLPSESGELKLSESEKRQAVDIEISHEDLKFIDRPIADYLSIAPLKSEPGDKIDDFRNVARK